MLLNISPREVTDSLLSQAMSDQISRASCQKHGGADHRPVTDAEAEGFVQAGDLHSIIRAVLT